MSARTFVVAAVVLLILACARGGPAEKTPRPDSEAPHKRLLIVNTRFDPELSDAYRSVITAVSHLAPQLQVDTLHYEKLTTAKLAELAPDALLLGPQGTPWWEYDKAKLDAAFAVVRGWEGPLLGICGGHQFLAMAYRGTVGAMKCADDHKGYQGCVQEEGFAKLTVVANDPLFADLPHTVQMREMHYEEVRDLPAGFEILASSDLCRVQAMRLKGRPVWGVQFHPERYSDGHPHGRQLLWNFLVQAGLARLPGAASPGTGQDRDAQR